MRGSRALPLGELILPYGAFGEPQYFPQNLRILPHRKTGNEPVKDRLQERPVDLDAVCIACRPRRGRGQTLAQGGVDDFLLILPPLAESWIGAYKPDNFQSCGQPIVALRVVEHLVHDLDEAGSGDDISLSLRILARQRKEEPFLVLKMVENGAAGLAGGLFQAADGGTLVAVLAKASASSVEYLCSAIVQIFFGHAWHDVLNHLLG